MTVFVFENEWGGVLVFSTLEKAMAYQSDRVEKWNEIDEGVWDAFMKAENEGSFQIVQRVVI